MDTGIINTFEDRRPITVVFETDRGALAALKDNPLILSEDVPGSYFANAVRRGVGHLHSAAIEYGGPGEVEEDYKPFPDWAVRVIWFGAGIAVTLGVQAVT